MQAATALFSKAMRQRALTEVEGGAVGFFMDHAGFGACSTAWVGLALTEACPTGWQAGSWAGFCPRPRLSEGAVSFAR
ncbi:hypothetical protein A7D27_01200 [Pseudomonas sp. 1D4]|nr:hypothetical protein A7D27_01200 [Pseudomonas sp. 1D4]